MLTYDHMSYPWFPLHKKICENEVLVCVLKIVNLSLLRAIKVLQKGKKISLNCITSLSS